MSRLFTLDVHCEAVKIPLPAATLEGTLSIPDGARSAVIFAQGRGHCRQNAVDTYLAAQFQNQGYATLLLELYTPREMDEDEFDGHIRFNVPMLGDRLTGVADWIARSGPTHHMSIGFMAASTGGAGALIAAANRADLVGAVVCRGARPDLAGTFLAHVEAPTLLIVGAQDNVVVGLNERALQLLPPGAAMETLAAVGHEFTEPGALEQLDALSLAWFNRHLTPNRAQ